MKTWKTLESVRQRTIKKRLTLKILRILRIITKWIFSSVSGSLFASRRLNHHFKLHFLKQYFITIFFYWIPWHLSQCIRCNSNYDPNFQNTLNSDLLVQRRVKNKLSQNRNPTFIFFVLTPAFVSASTNRLILYSRISSKYHVPISHNPIKTEQLPFQMGCYALFISFSFPISAAFYILFYS